MSEANEAKDKDKKTLSLGGAKTLSLKGAPGASGPPAPAPRQNVPHGRGRTVAVEVIRSKRAAPGEQGPGGDLKHLTSEEREVRLRALREAEEAARKRAEEAALAAINPTPAARQGKPKEDSASARERELAEAKRIEEEERIRRERVALGLDANPQGYNKKGALPSADEEEEETYRSRMKRTAPKPARRETMDKRRTGKLTVTQVLNEDYEKERGPSLAAQRRAREKARIAAMASNEEPQKIIRDVIVPEVITVQELSNRMAERSGDLIKALMKMGVLATINQAIDADTAELLVTEFGHRIKRVTEADVEEGISGPVDSAEDMQPRPPVVTIMGHVDHGKTSLLDALRHTDVVSGEAGGITQHIGAYQVTLKNGGKITFLDTPGHAAFTEMRARGAHVTDIVILVVAANDSIMPQTVEAINHAKAAKVPIIVAINKVDLHDANPQKVKQDLLQHEIIVEELSGDVLCVEVSAKNKTGLEKLEEGILLQAEILELQANPNRAATGAVVEAKLEQGRGHVATVLIQTGTLHVGDIFVMGSEWGRVRAIIDDRGQNIDKAIPGQPVEVLGAQGAPEAGDQMTVIEDESRAREIASYRQRKRREAQALKAAGTASLEDLMELAKAGKKKELAVVIKADVHGSVEAIVGSLKKIEDENPEIAVRVLHAGVGGITESDVTLAKASNALIIGFNVRANTQARQIVEKDHVNMRYYNIIYNVIDDAKAMLSGLLAPSIREVYLGNASVRQVFNITKVGKIAGCMVTSGVVKRGSKVRLLRDSVVIHEGTLKTLKRFKDEVKEVKEGTECGMAFENYDDLKEGDVIECFDLVSEARTVG
jgi:translation initiation factor IF-2